MNSFVAGLVHGSLKRQAKQMARTAVCWGLAAQLVGLPFAAAAGDSSSSSSASATADKPAPKAANDPVLKVMQAELARATSDLGKTDSAPYYMSYTVYDQNLVVLVGAYGSLLTDASLKRRQADVVMRVGAPALDNTHGQSRSTGMTSKIISRTRDCSSSAFLMALIALLILKTAK